MRVTGELGALGLELDDDRVDAAHRQPEMIEALIGRGRSRVDAVAGGNRRNEDIGAAELEVDARLALLHGAHDLGAEHALVVLGGGFRVRAAQMDVVVAVHWHGITPHWISGWVEMNLADLSASTCGARTSTPEASSCNKKVTLLSLLPQPRTMP